MNEEIHDEGLGVRIVDSLKILKKMYRKIEEAKEYLKDKAEEFEAYNGAFANEIDAVHVENIVRGAYESNYWLIAETLRIIQEPFRNRRHRFNLIHE